MSAQKTVNAMNNQEQDMSITDILFGGIMASFSLYLLWCTASLFIAALS